MKNCGTIWNKINNLGFRSLKRCSLRTSNVNVSIEITTIQFYSVRQNKFCLHRISRDRDDKNKHQTDSNRINAGFLEILLCTVAFFLWKTSFWKLFLRPRIIHILIKKPLSEEKRCLESLSKQFRSLSSFDVCAKLFKSRRPIMICTQDQLKP